MILKLRITSSVLKPVAQSDAWLPAELSPFPTSGVSDNTNTTTNTAEEITLSICFMRGQYFLKEDSEWISIGNQKQLKINDSNVITLSSESLPKPSVFKKSTTLNSKSSKLGASSSETFSYSTGLSPLGNLTLPESARKDPLGFLRKGAELKPSKPSLVNLLVTSDEG